MQKTIVSDPYQILGIKKGAGADEIRSAYKRMARTHHPDKGGDSTSFIKISVAYRQLMCELPCEECGGEGYTTVKISPYAKKITMCGKCKQ
jgi:DnaJ-class molecular chaperone